MRPTTPTTRYLNLLIIFALVTSASAPPNTSNAESNRSQLLIQFDTLANTLTDSFAPARLLITRLNFGSIAGRNQNQPVARGSRSGAAPTGTPSPTVTASWADAPSPTTTSTAAGPARPTIGTSTPFRVQSSVTPTNEWVNFYGFRVLIDGAPAPAGTVIRAYNSTGVLAGEVTMSATNMYGLMPVYRDDPNTTQIEGLKPGEAVSFTVDGRAAALLGPDTAVWTTNGDLKRVDLAAGKAPPPLNSLYLPLVSGGRAQSRAPVSAPTSGTTVVISLQSGWNLISFPVLPANTAIESVLSPIAGLYSVVLSYDQGGLSYYPSIPASMNTLHSMDPYHGYWILMTSPGTLVVNGNRLDEGQPVTLNPGWNLVSYLPANAQPVASALNSITGQFSAVLGYDQGALSYYPNLPPNLNTLKTLDLNHGYWIHQTAAASLVYPVAAQTATPLPTASPIQALPKTPTSMPSLQPSPTLGPRLIPVTPPTIISSNTTWQATDGVYVINGTVSVNQGVSLTILPGTVVKFYPNSGLLVNGTLIAVGTSGAPIVLTSIRDDAYAGDTNSDGSTTLPAAGDWGNLYFGPTSTGNSLQYARVTYGGSWNCYYNCSSPWQQPANVYVSGAAPLIDSVTVEFGTSYGLLLANSANPVVSNSHVAHIAGTGIRIIASSAPTLSNNLIESNNGYAVFMDANTAPHFSGNQALNNRTNGIGVSGIIAPSVTWDSDLPYIVDGGLSINPGITLNLQPGAIIKFKDSNQSLTVNGTLHATGLVTATIVFTSLKDDSAGGDTNNDGSLSRPAPGDWGNITFSNSSANSLMDYVAVRYGGYTYYYNPPQADVIVNGSAPTISHSTIAYSGGHGVALSNVAMPTLSNDTIANNNANGLDMATSSAPTLTNNGFVSNTGFAIHMDGTCSIDASGNTASNNTYNGVGVSGAVTSATSWPANLTYIIDGSLTINTGVVLTLQPGVVVKFRSGYILVKGNLQAVGTAGNPIVFTSLNDTASVAGGQTLGRQTLKALDAALAPGDWDRLEFASTSSGSTLNYVQMRYGGSNYTYGSLYLNGGAPSLSNVTIANSSSNGMYVSGSSPTIANSIFTANAYTGIYLATFANPTIQNNLIYSNTQYGVYNASSGVNVDATHNWWGSATGPMHASNPGGSGDRVSDGVTFSPWFTSPVQPTPTPYPTPGPTPAASHVSGQLSTNTTWTAANSPYVVDGSVTVNTGVILSVQPGVIVKFQNGQGLTVNGVLAASGTISNPVVFTAYTDDTYGGDTNGDGTASRPVPGYWAGIYLGPAASASTLAYTLVRYASTGVQVDSSSPTLSNDTLIYSLGSGVSVINAGAPTIQNSIVRENGAAGISLTGSSPVIQNNIFVNNGGAAINMDGNSLPTNSGSQAYYNVYNGIAVSGDIGTRGTWHHDLPYVVSGVTVDTGVILNIEAGTIVKFVSSGLTINGALVANGTAGTPIQFTSINDDSVGGDTNNNGSQTWPAPGDWSAIQFTASSLSSSALTYANVTYGGVSVTGASPTIAHDTIAYANGYGLQLASLASPSIHDNIIRDNRSDGLYLGSSSAPIVQNNQFIRNQGYAVHMDASSTATFVGNTATNNRTNGIGVFGDSTATNTWQSNLPYIIESLTIDSGTTLTLQPGVVVKLSGSYITANGNLVAAGISTNPIVFTSLKDDAYGGDTNNDGNSTNPAAGDWAGIQFTSSSTGSRLDQVLVRYGGASICCYWYGSLNLNGVSVPVRNTHIYQSLYYGLNIANASPTINNVDISGSQTGIYLTTANPTISNSNIHDNTQNGIYGSGSNPTITGTTISNDSQGVTFYSTNAPYPHVSGDTFANNLSYAASIEIGALPTFGANTFVGTVGNGVNIGAGTLTQNATLYGAGVYVIGQTIIEQGSTLTVQPGAIVKANHPNCYYYYYNCSGIIVRGVLTALGTSANPIVFTSLRDDAYGGDTNGDGTLTGPVAGDWAGIYFGPTSGTSTVDHAIIQYSGAPICDSTCFYGGVSVSNASPTLSNLTIRNNSSYGIYLTGASPTITGTSISGQSYGIYAVYTSSATINNNTISSSGEGIYLDDFSRANIVGNTFVTNPTAVDLNASVLPSVGSNTASTSTGNAISARSGTISANATLYPSIVYVLAQTTVSAGAVLTVLPGTVVKFTPYPYSCYYCGYLLMRGRLVAQGNASQKIVFTSLKDDTHGGDTNNDGNNSVPNPGDWGGIYLSTSDSNLDNVVVQYGGGYFAVDSNTYYAALILNNIAPNITNATIARSSGYGIQVINANPNISNDDIWGNSIGVYSQNGARPGIHSNTIHDNSGYGVYNADTTLVVDATNNSWGDDSGPAPVGAGSGVNYSDTCCDAFGHLIRTYYVAFDPWNGKTHWIEQNLGVLKQWIAYVAEPVNTATGNYTYNFQDLFIPGRGPSLDFHRYYNSQSATQGPLGHGWTFSYGLSVTPESGDVLVAREDGRVDKYVQNGSAYTPPLGIYDLLTSHGGLFTLTLKDQTRYQFDGSGRLASIVDKNGNATSLSYSGANLTSVTDSAGRSLTINYDGSNRITQTADPAGRTFHFTYDGFSNLASVTDARNNTTNYAYDSQHRLLTITDANGHIFVTNIYDANGRVITQRDARLNNTNFSYDTNAKVTVVTDPRGNATTYTYDAQLRLQSERDAAGQTATYSYDSNSNRISATDRRGNITRYGYDTLGNTTVITDARSGVTLMTYDGLNDLTSQTDPLSRTTTYLYDAKGNLIGTTNADNKPTSYTYDANGLMTSATDARGNTTHYGYDTYGDQTSVTNALNQTTTSSFDIAGRRLHTTDALGRVMTDTYDANNNLLTEVNALGGQTSYTYDPVGNRLTTTDALGRVTTYSYDQKDKPSRIVNPLLGVTSYTYDANDNKVGETDPLTHTTTYNYDALNRLSQVIDPLGHTTSYGYDVDGNRTSVTDPNGRTTNFVFDALNRLTQATDPILDTTTYVYDAVGNKIRVIDANGNTTFYTYDALNRLTLVTDALGGVVHYAYDAAGNKVSMTDANTHTTGYAYDALNRLTGVTDPLSNQVQYSYDAVGNRTLVVNARSQNVAYAYDNLNRLMSVTYPVTGSVAYSYDAVGNRTQMVDATGTTTYTYDVLNRPIVIGNPGGLVVTYGYDAAGNRTQVTYPDGKVVSYAYDTANRLASVSDWLSRTTTYSYDNVGNLTGQANPNNTSVSQTYDAANRLTGLINSSTVSGTIASFNYTLDKMGNRTSVVDTDGTTTYEYDKLYRLTAVTYPDATSASYQYDAMGNRQVMTATAGVVSYNYDAADRLLNAGPITFTWDADGNMLSKGGTAFTFDAINQLTGVVSGTLNEGFTYDGDGRRASKSINGTATQYIYDTIAGLAYVLSEKTGISTTLYTYGTDLVALTAPDTTQSYYHYDGLGSTRALSNGSGQVTVRYSYDAFGAVRTSSGTASTSFKFTGEQSDDEIGLIYLRARYYDPALGRFVTKDSYGGTDSVPSTFNRYVYVNNNPVNVLDPTGKDWLDALGVGLAVGGLALAVAGLVVTAPIVAAGLAAAGVAVAGAGIIVTAQQFARDTNSRDWGNSTPAQQQAWLAQDQHDLEFQLGSLGLGWIGTGMELSGNDALGNVLGAAGNTVDIVGQLSSQNNPSAGKSSSLDVVPTELRSASNLAVGLGLEGFERFAASKHNGSATDNVTAYQQFLRATPYGALLSAVQSGPQSITPEITSQNYVALSPLLQHAGFNPAHPQSPPSHSK